MGTSLTMMRFNVAKLVRASIIMAFFSFDSKVEGSNLALQINFQVSCFAKSSNNEN